MAVFISRTFDLDVEPGTLPPILKVKQYDGNGTKVYVANLYNDSSPYIIPSAVNKITIQGSKRDGTGFSYDCSFSNNKITFNLMRQMTVLFGDVICDFVFYDNEGNQITSHSFVLRVYRSSVQDGQITSQDDFRTLISYVRETESYKNWAKSYAIGGTGLREDEETNNSEYNYKLSKSYAIGNSGIRSGEDTDNAKYYHDDIQAERIQIDLNKTDIQSIQSQIEQYLDPPAENVGEVVNARIGFDGTVYNSLGDAIRTQMTKFGYVAVNEEIYFSNNS